MSPEPLSALQIGLIGRGDSTGRLATALQSEGVGIRYQLTPAELGPEHLAASDLQVWLLDVQDCDWNDRLDALMDGAQVPLFFNEHGALERQPHVGFWCRNLVRHMRALIHDNPVETSTSLYAVPANASSAVPLQRSAEPVVDGQLLTEIEALSELLQAEAALTGQRFDDELGLDQLGDEIVLVKADEALEADALAAIPLLGEPMIWPETPVLPVADTEAQAFAATASNVIPLLTARQSAALDDDNIPLLQQVVVESTETEDADCLYDGAVSAQEPLSCDLWVLGSSLGGPAALKRFFTALVEPMPVCFLIAQHIDGHFVPVLAKIIEQANAFYKVNILNRPGLVEAGTVLMTPTDKRLRFLEAGQIVQCQRNWTPPYAPSIDDVLLDAAAAYPGQVHTIIFSGMGEDGIAGVRRVHEQGGQVWAQDSDSCASAVMPEGAVNTGTVQYCGTPEQLAERLSAHYRAAAVIDQQNS